MLKIYIKIVPRNLTHKQKDNLENICADNHDITHRRTRQMTFDETCTFQNDPEMQYLSYQRISVLD